MQNKKTNESIKDNSFRFNKQFGQNFISDGNLLSAIVSDAGVTEIDNVLEIGAGAGALTQKLSEKAKKVVSFEIDNNLKPILSETLAGCNNVELIFENALETSMEKIEKLFNGEKFKVVANLPYYITTPLIFKFLEETDKVSSITVMVQKEVAERLASKPSTDEYGTITPLCNYHAIVSIKRNVGRQMFRPVPNVDSAIVHFQIDRTRFDCLNYENLKKIVHSAFSMRRKTLLNNLNSAGFNKEKVEKILASLSLSPSIRGEALTTAQFIELSNLLK
ncbi:MAG: 16S rRNA (adenine(1518)-N(6)/adenine(1519)-N(6))-dimethyltransferase RsmA [Clostridia bacterium]